MKIWQGILLAVLLAAIPALSACGPSAAERQQLENYQKSLEAFKKQQDEYNKQYLKAIEDYQKELQKSYQNYSDNLSQYYQHRIEILEKQLEAVGAEKAE